MPVRLTSLELSGYKTFASRTEFVFADSITAIVGPNGSGKSNIADALRWVLGEQSYSLLRGRRTEDMIFSGSEHRTRSGMASARILFDNSDGWLPIDFSEVSITRRAYRDGQNEYLINEQRVRLRDVSELLAQSGLAERTYTIIGQGLVDAALALRPDERRRLFEEAAGIGLYRSRRVEAMRRLETTRRNLERVQDILAELKPRLRSLERQAKRAEQFEQVKIELREILKEWYGYHWHRTQERLVALQGNARKQESQLQVARRKQAEFDKQFAHYRQHIQEIRERLNKWHRHLSGLHSRRETISRQLAVLTERVRLIRHQQEETGAEFERYQEEIAIYTSTLEEASQEVALRDAELAQAQEQAIGVQRKLDDKQVSRKEIQGKLQATRRRLDGFALQQSKLTARKTELAAWLERQNALEERARQGITTAKGAYQQAESHLKPSQKSVENARQARHKTESNLEEIRQKIHQVDQIRQDLNKVQTAREAEIARFGAQLEVLTQADTALVGYASGAKFLLQTIQTKQLPGGKGSLKDHIEVPEELEIAVASALGDFLDSILVDTQRNAEHALDLLLQKRLRGILLPIENIHPVSSPSIPSDPTCLGLASELVQVTADLKPAIDVLLGEVFVVRDRAAANKLLSDQPPGIRAVTLHGEVFYSGGPILTRGESLGTSLGRSRQRSRIKEKLKAVQAEFTAVISKVDQASERYQELKQVEGELLADLRSQRAQEVASLEEFRQVRGKVEEARQQISWQKELLESLQTEIQRGQSESKEIEAHEARLDLDTQQTQRELLLLTQQLASVALDDDQMQLNHWGLQVAIAERSLAAARKHQEERQDEFRKRQARFQSLSDRQVALSGELERLKLEIQQLRIEEQEVAKEIDQISASVQPAEEDLTAAEKEQDSFLGNDLKFRQVLSQTESQYTQAQVSLARQQESMEALRRRIEDDFGLVAFEYADSVSGPTPLPFEGMVEQLPRIVELSPEIEDALKRKRAQIRRIGAVNPEAQEEHQAVRERYEFLITQMTDLEKADKDIRAVISQLDVLMEREFRKTFDAVADEFRQIFTRLFGGGSARLVLTSPDDLTQTGIDIEARLPGRREQGLSLLSGGERSLTATALVFALLKVSPTPFCVLDEVDAMLDEANVGRFRELLRELSGDTQFVLITHNRGTVQAADVIYGVTMGRDSASQVLSLKMDEVVGVYAS